MSLLGEIQESLLDPQKPIGPILLKLRFLASRLGSAQLEEWVKHESEGYSKDTPIPDYRKLQASYSGTFTGPFGSGIRNAPIPPYLVKKFAGDKWTTLEMRESIAAVDDLANAPGDFLEIDSANLMLLLQGKVYEDFACNSVTGKIPKGAVKAIQNAVRNRVMELTIALERAVPTAKEVTLAKSVDLIASQADTVTQIFNQTIHGPYTAVTSTGDGVQITLNLAQGNGDAVIAELTRAGIPHSDATEFAGILAAEKPHSVERPFGAKATAWLTKAVGKAADGGWKIGVSVATKLLEEAAMRYYGLK